MKFNGIRRGDIVQVTDLDSFFFGALGKVYKAKENRGMIYVDFFDRVIEIKANHLKVMSRTGSPSYRFFEMTSKDRRQRCL